MKHHSSDDGVSGEGLRRALLRRDHLLPQAVRPPAVPDPIAALPSLSKNATKQKVQIP